MLLENQDIERFVAGRVNTTRAKYLAVLKEYVEVTGGELTTQAIDKYVEAISNQAPNTRFSKLAVLSSFLKWKEPALREYLRERHRFSKLQQEVPIEPLTRQEIKKLLNTARKYPPHIALAIELMLRTGIRRSELSKIQVNNDGIWIERKGGKMQFIPVEQELLDRLKGLGRPLPSGKVVEKALAKISKEAGIKRTARVRGGKVKEVPIRPHLLRHTLATMLLNEGVNIRVVQEVLGHSSLRTTQRYLKVTADDVKNALQKVKI
jgi:integrase/recombinase XerD